MVLAFAAALATPLPAGAEPSAVDLRPKHYDPPRNWAEASVDGGGALRDCLGPCDAVDPFGPTLGLTLLARTSRSFAVGWIFQKAWFRWHPPDQGPTQTIDVTLIGPVARAYFFEHGRLDPWVELAVPSFSWNASGYHTNPPGVLGVAGAAGLDVFVTDFMKIGPRVQGSFAFDTASESGSAMYIPHGPEAPSAFPAVVLGIGVTFTAFARHDTPPAGSR